MTIEQEINIIPGYTEASSIKHPEYCDLKENTATIRGIKCKKQKLNVPAYKKGKKLENVYFWRPIDGITSDFEAGLNLVLSKGIFNNTLTNNKNSILKFIKKK